MKTEVAGTTLELVQGDITEQDVEAIVNAANSGLRGGGGVDGAIHRAGGPEIMEGCRDIGGCPTGDAVITTGGELPAAHVIHAVGPRYRDGASGEEEKLASAYRRSLEVARDNEVKTIAFPSLSTGAYGYPIGDAARVALRTVMDFLEDNPDTFELVRFVLFSESDYETYADALKQLHGA